MLKSWNRRTLIITLILTLTGAAAQTTWALDVKDLNLNVEPIVGLERTQKLLPDVHSTTRLFYGARVTGGYRLIALEAEYTRAQDEESFPLTSTSTTSTADRVKIGLRSELLRNPFISGHARLGGQARRETTELTVSGSTTTETTPTTYEPYAGFGIRAFLTPKIGLTAEVVAVFRDFPNDFAQNDYQGSAGVTVAFP